MQVATCVVVAVMGGQAGVMVHVAPCPTLSLPEVHGHGGCGLRWRGPHPHVVEAIVVRRTQGVRPTLHLRIVEREGDIHSRRGCRRGYGRHWGRGRLAVVEVVVV